jgi:hypothetical protein
VVPFIIRRNMESDISPKHCFRIHPRVNPWFSAKADKIDNTHKLQ